MFYRAVGSLLPLDVVRKAILSRAQVFLAHLNAQYIRGTQSVISALRAFIYLLKQRHHRFGR